MSDEFVGLMNAISWIKQAGFKVRGLTTIV